MTRSEMVRSFREFMDENAPGWRKAFAEYAVREIGPQWTTIGMRLYMQDGEELESTFLVNPDRVGAGAPDLGAA